MKRFSLFLVLQTIIFSGFAQEDDNRIAYDEPLLKKVLNREFTSLLNGLPTHSIGNYLSIDQKDSRATFAFSRVNADYNIMSFTLNGAAPGGVVTLVNNSRVTYDISAGFQYHFFGNNNRYFIDHPSEEKLQKEYADLIKKFKKDTAAVAVKFVKGKLTKELELLKKPKTALSNRLSMYNDSVFVKAIKDSLRFRIVKLEFQLTELKGFVENKDKKLKLIEENKGCLSDTCKKERSEYERKQKLLTKSTKFEAELAKLKPLLNTEFPVFIAKEKEKLEKAIVAQQKRIAAKKKEKEEYDKLEETKKKLALTTVFNKKKTEITDKLVKATNTYKFKWVSIGGKVSRNQFKLFDAEAAFAEQVSDTTFTGVELSVQYSYYNSEIFKRLNPVYLNFGAAMRFRDNLSDLKKLTFSQEEALGTDGDTTRSTATDIKVFSGDYRANLNEIFLYGDFYAYLFKKNNVALHWNPTVNIREGQKAFWNMDFGLILSFKNPKNKNAIVNTELFYSLRDLTNTTKSDFRLFERNTVGLRATVPLKFKTN